jgi:hypothetical protein
MKRILPVLMAGVMALESMVPGGDLGELLKIPELLVHYQLHRHEDQSLSLIGFFDLHYGDTGSHESDSHNHDKLPFGGHHQHNCQLHQVVYTLPDPLATPSVITSPSETNEWAMQLSPFQTVTSIWQPPRRA